MLRTLLEKFSRNIVLKRKLPSRYGGLPLFVSPSASLRFWKPSLESAGTLLFRMASETVKPSDVVWDIGANVGLFSFAAAGLAGKTGRVLAIEPDIFLFDLLRRSSDLNYHKAAQVDILPVAIGESLGIGEFCLVRRERSANFVKGVPCAAQTGGVYKKVKVLVVTLDWLLGFYLPPKVLKIDIEGSEKKALLGAKKILTQVRPIIICEIFSEHIDSVSEIFKENGYLMYNARLEPENRKQLFKAVYDTVAYPRELLKG